MKHSACLVVAWLVVACAAVGCGDTGGERVSVPFSARGARADAVDVGDWQVTLEVARVGIGPIYFCAADSSSTDLCSEAVAEFASSTTLDALDPKARRIGELDALTQSVRSVGWDYAITWPSYDKAPVVLTGAPGGHSAHFEGTAQRGSRQLPFVLDLDIQPLLQGTRSVQGIPTRVTITDSTRCELDLDPAQWWSQVDFDQLAKIADARVSAAGASAGEPLVIDATASAYQTLGAALTSTTPPTFRWSSNDR